MCACVSDSELVAFLRARHLWDSCCDQLESMEFGLLILAYTNLYYLILLRGQDKLQKEQKHRHRNFISIFTHRHRLGDIDVKNIDNRKQTLCMFRHEGFRCFDFRHRCPITTDHYYFVYVRVWTIADYSQVCQNEKT